MTTLSLIVAMTRNRVIGRDNTLPWRLPDDLRRFKALTLHHTVIMGRRTFESLPSVLPDRHSIVVSRDPRALEGHSGIETACSLAEALERSRPPEVFVIGGASLYEQTLASADRLYITEIDAVIEGDAFFPAFAAEDWITLTKEVHAADDRHPYAFRYLTLERRT